MSDLVPFVAAIIRDKTVDDMKDELEKMKEQRDRQFLVQITGPNGTPIYYHGSLLDDGYNSPFGFRTKNGDFWAVNLKSNNNDDDAAAGRVTFNGIEELEFRLAGIVLQHLKMEQLRFQVKTHLFDQKRQMCDTIIGNKSTKHPIATIFAVIGPIPCSSQEELETITRRIANADVLVQDMNMIITKLFFQKSRISGILSLLENIGVNTARKTPPPSTTTCIEVTWMGCRI